MAAPARLLFPAQSKRPAEQSADPMEPTEPTVLDLCMLSAEGSCAEAPLTSEPPLPDFEPLTSEPPLSDAAPLTSEPSVVGADPAGVCADPSGL
ncbi:MULTISPECIES: hypothetical protein [Streptomyces]|uniref:Secreted protein n=2 Tax=Streptomyces griseoaurantiacus TaxID=68213 RepID=F3NA95_9ACTN|nr:MULTISPECIES: hypothetical protein [Streptomyces]GHE70914.1 hypothetical protein GCM10018782_50950 [Streptomyces griseoaurantiacus]EGG49204.1 hypothetical protein SGM_0279 [Streptomyces griseoaurantiacus M045]MCF0086507.1 hypothetical protein [Streptomyces sp. MH192]MCF0100709.1 hypothetical protein [Streptomyces sp. MH191]MDX3090748.1 hypothetical protein [Streptomyces sp. ME12-02E]